MKTKELIEGIKWWSSLLSNNFDLRTNQRNPTDKILWYDYTQKDDELVDEIIKRLKELDEVNEMIDILARKEGIIK